jgi:hypothetical protein
MRHSLLLLLLLLLLVYMLTTRFLGTSLFYSDGFPFSHFFVAAPFSCNRCITNSGFVV